jgi:NAD+ synthase (glutamine-hydrolysing)
MDKHGFFRIATISPRVSITDPVANAQEIAALAATHNDSNLIVFPELAVTGYTCGDYFGHPHLIKAAEQAAIELWKNLPTAPLIFVGCPVRVQDSLYNCALAFQDRKLIGIVPKTYMPNYGEFYEGRHFTPWNPTCPDKVWFAGGMIPFGPDLIFSDDARPGHIVRVFAEICEDLWMPIPPSSYAALNGAQIIVNLSASNELVAKSEYRIDLVKNQSARCVAAYAYASANSTESTSDLVFGGHCMIAENGNLLQQSKRVGRGLKYKEIASACADVDIMKLVNDRAKSNTFTQSKRVNGANKFRQVPVYFQVTEYTKPELLRYVSPAPFVPSDPATLQDRCADIFGIQTHGICKRFEQLQPDTPLVIGVSGGLDSTLALLATVRACDELGIPHSRIHGATMPGFGTSQRTKDNAVELMRILGVTMTTMPITHLSADVMTLIRHAPFGKPQPYDYAMLPWINKQIEELPPDELKDLTFENIQARLRTLLLFSKGFVIGTGDLSESALGWCTYNGDHMSNYNPNCTVPKTLVKFVVRYIADKCIDDFMIEGGSEKRDKLASVLYDILDTPVSPELLPLGKDGQHAQKTESVLGAYELHDFILFNFLRNQFPPEKIAYLMTRAKFSVDYTEKERNDALRTFMKRFVGNQFKRNCVPDGPKVGSVGLSPRGDWRAPSDASPNLWLSGVPNER